MSGYPGAVRGYHVFTSLSRSPCRATTQPVRVQFLALAECEDVRVAYSISRKVGGAVIRNRWRRRVRAIVATAPEALMPGAYLIGLAPDVTELTYDELRDRVIETMQRASQGSR